MSTIHLKSSCCKAVTYHYGGRRRRCSKCKATWSIRQKKRGRKAVRVHANSKLLAFAGSESLRHKAQRLHKGRELIRRRHRKNLDSLFHKLSAPKIPSGPLIAIADALWRKFQKQEYTCYLILLRSVSGSFAIALDPVILTGHESSKGWKTVFEQLLPAVKTRIKALVCDGLTGLETYGRHQGWAVQRCHFHLLSNLQSLRGKRWMTAKAKPLREEIYQAVCRILKVQNRNSAKRLVRYLRALILQPSCPKWLGLRVRGFLEQWQLFRTYLNYPELSLPTTTNSAECAWSLLANTLHQTRGFRNIQSFERWVIVQVRTIKSIKCQGSSIQQN